ncbi:hypothetical protein [Paraburkholderia fungorum]
MKLIGNHPWQRVADVKLGAGRVEYARATYWMQWAYEAGVVTPDA